MDGKYRICIVRDDGSLRDCGEGPFDSFNEAKEFQRNEVGAKSVIVEVHIPLTVTYQTQLLDLPKEILLPLDPTPVDEIANCTVGQYLQAMEGTGGVVPDGSLSFLRSVLEDFDNLGELIWRPE